jgi:hypothetical protein
VGNSGKAKEGDRFIKPDTGKIYVIARVVMEGDWVILKEERGTRQTLTSQESLETWKKMVKESGSSG